MMKVASDIFETPDEYIRRVGSSFPPKEIGTTSISSLLRELHGSEESARKELEALREVDYAQRLLKELMPGLPEVFPKLIRDGILAVGEVNDPTPNARAVCLDGFRYAVVYNGGLSRFLYRVTRALSTRFYPTGSEHSSDTMTFEESCRILTDVFFWYRETGQAFGPDYPVTQFQAGLASMLATEAETFFLAHELGHVFNHLQAYFTEPTPIAREAAWNDEFAADRFALIAVINSRNREGAVAPVEIAYAGAEIALSIFGGLEALGVTFAHSHPPAHERLNAMRMHIRTCIAESSIAGITAASEPLDLLFGRIIDRLRAPDWESFLDRAAGDVMAELERLLDQCTGGFVPDYSRFNLNVGKLLDRLSSHRLYERVASAAANFARHTKMMRDNAGNAAKNEARISFQKFKLFASMSQNVTTPLSSLLEEALGFRS